MGSDQRQVVLLRHGRQTDSKWYYIATDGKLTVSTTIDSCEVGADGTKKDAARIWNVTERQLIKYLAHERIYEMEGSMTLMGLVPGITYDAALYIRYSSDEISKSPILKINPNISWTHYIQLMRMQSEDERHFYELEFTGLPEKSSYTETEQEQKLIDHLQQFLLELEKGFAFMGRQVQFTFEADAVRTKRGQNHERGIYL